MRKLLFFSLALGVAISSVAQNKFAARDMSKLPVASKKTVMDPTMVPFLPLNKPSAVRTKASPFIAQVIGTSGNMYGILYEPCNWLDADPALNAVIFTHRAGGAWGGSSGDLRCKYTINNGTTWDSVQYLTNGTQLHRYPNGVMYNPVGNTNISNVYSVVCGPITNGSGWINNYYHSQTLGGANLSMTYLLPDTTTDVLERVNLCGGNGNYHVMGLYDDGTSYLYAKVRNGVFNSTNNNFDWGTPTVVSRLFNKRHFSNATVDNDQAWNTAFAADGIHGYAYCMGGDSACDPYHTGLPLVWETTTAGATWDTLPASGCWHTLSNLTDQIWPTNESWGTGNEVFRPFFEAGSSVDDNMLPGVVDYQGNLHIACIVDGRYSSHPDSLDYGYANHPTLLFDVYQTQSNAGGWDVRYIDSIQTDVVDAATSGYGASPDEIGWEHMIHMTRSEDGKVIFVTWTDTDPQWGATTNTTPGVKGRAWNIETNMATPIVDFTPYPDGGQYFFINTSDIALKQGSIYTIPMTYLDIWENGDPLAGCNLNYVSNMEYDESTFTVPYGNSTINGTCITCFTNVDNNNINTPNFSVSQNYPNPANDVTSIKVKLAETSNVTIEITNMIGQKVAAIDKGRMNSGSHDISINLSNLNSGIYFYTVKAGNNIITNKMIVE